MAVIAEDEAERISKRMKDALAAAKKRGKKLGGFRGFMPTARMRKLSVEARQERTEARAANLAPIIAELQAGKRVCVPFQRA
jgi:DNA invertase Pin-like site-specific DNA recombinase